MNSNINEKSSLFSNKKQKTYSDNNIEINNEDSDSITSSSESVKSKRTVSKTSICPTCHGK